MKSTPMIFNGAMVRAILEGRKTMTRRIVKPQPGVSKKGALTGEWLGKPLDGLIMPTLQDIKIHCPFGRLGDRIWVRETCSAMELANGQDGVHYHADSGWIPIDNTQAAADEWLKLYTYRGQKGATVPAIHMPRWACRVTLEITEIRVERLQDISDDDCYEEGTQVWAASAVRNGNKFSSIRRAFRALWESTGGNWDANPYVWRVSFKRV